MCCGIVMNITSLFIEITNLCNKRCLYCYNKEDDLIREKYFVELNSFYKMIDKADCIQIDKIIVSGGEPTLHSEFYNMIQYVVSKNMYCKINSNAYNDEKLIKVSKDFNNKIGFQFTLDGYNIAHDRFRGNGDYQHILYLIKRIRKQGYDGDISIRYNLHANNFNVSEINDIYKDFGAYANYIYISPIVGTAESTIKSREYMSVLKYIKFIDLVRAKIQLFTPPLSCTLMHISNSSNLSPLIDVHGNVYLCQMSLYNKNFCLGNVFSENLNDILSENNIFCVLEKIKEQNACNNKCTLHLFCDGGCKGLITENGCDGFCELRKTIFINNLKIKRYQCWG